MEKYTTITISRETRDRLAKLGKFGQSYDALIQELLEWRKENGV
jgi:predicted CopG family antitoxin